MQERTWQDDPCVQLEDTVVEALSKIQKLIVDSIGTPAPSTLAFVKTASNMLRFKALKSLSRQGIDVSKTLTRDMHKASEAFDTLITDLEKSFSTQFNLDQAKRLMARVSDETRPAINTAIASYRDIYIGAEIAEQDAYAKQSRDAIATLEKVSKQIFFISINASVEAARVGEAGKGFTQISSDIRALSHSAQSATQGLSSLVKNNAA